MTRLSLSDLRVPALLLALSAIPVIGGLVRLQSLGPGAVVAADEARFVAAPVPIAIHVVAATLYCIVGAFLFSSGVRLRWPRGHRLAGKLVALCGIAAALTGMWMAVGYAIPLPMQGPLVQLVRLLVGAAMAASIVLGSLAILQRDVPRHEAWMIRAYALGPGAGTQAVLLLPVILIHGAALGLLRDVLMTLAWAINVAVAEFIIRHRNQRARRRPTPISRRPSLA